MRYILKPNEPVKIILEPWNIEIVCARTRFEGNESHDIRVWGRRRILILERLISVAKKFTVHLLGSGMPSFYVADLGDLNFTLGLSGWTANDWSKSGNFDLLASRGHVDDWTKENVFNELKKDWFATPDQLSGRLHLDRATILSALSAYTQAGRAIYDLNKGVYRARELSREPLPLEKLRFANEREEAAMRFQNAHLITFTKRKHLEKGGLYLAGSVREGKNYSDTTLTIDGDGRLVDASCNCYYFTTNRLYRGPCEHILALKMAEQMRGR